MKITSLNYLPIKKITHNDNYLFIHKLDGYVLVYYAAADCCSSSFIEDFDQTWPLIDTTLLSVEKECGHQEDDGNNVLKWTFYKFTTTKGSATLSFRNESNGYYNGNLEFSKEVPNHEIEKDQI